jgi:hypothetical protein
MQPADSRAADNPKVATSDIRRIEVDVIKRDIFR